MTDERLIKVIAFDPGTTTGWATGYVLDDQLVVTNYGYDPWKDVALKYDNTQRNPDTKIDVMVYESFYLRKAKAMQLVGSDFPVIKFIGGVLVTSWATGTTIVKQEPAHKPVIDQMMKGTGYLPVSEVEHDRDALRHLYYWAATKGGADLSKTETR